MLPKYRDKILDVQQIRIGGLNIHVITDMHVISDADGDPNYPPIGNRLTYTSLNKLRQWANAIITGAIEKPDGIINLGDIVNGDGDDNYDQSFDSFMVIWNSLPADIPKFQSAGNHDYSNKIPSMVGDLTKHQYVAGKLGYGGRTPIAGCLMNETFVITKNGVSVRFINFDSNQNKAGQFVINGGYQSEDQMAWMTNVLANAEEENILMFTHRYRPLMEESECLKIEHMVANAKAAKPKMKVHLFWGHSHPPHIKRGTPKVAGSFNSMFNFPAIVDNLTAYSVRSDISNQKVESLKEYAWVYTP